MQGINKMLPPVPTQWGAPLTGAQMKLLRAAGLTGRYKAVTSTSAIMGPVSAADFSIRAEFYLPANHPAYTLANAGWLDGRNVVLWFGGDKAPDDIADASQVLLADGSLLPVNPWLNWGRDQAEACPSRFIIAYTRKAEGLTTHADRVLADAERMAKRMGGKFVKNELWGDVVAASGNTITLSKMTEAEVSEVALSYRMTTGEVWGAIKFCRSIGLIKPEPTRLERFWATRDTKDVYGPPCKAFQLIEEALEFER